MSGKSILLVLRVDERTILAHLTSNILEVFATRCGTSHTSIMTIASSFEVETLDSLSNPFNDYEHNLVCPGTKKLCNVYCSCFHQFSLRCPCSTRDTLSIFPRSSLLAQQSQIFPNKYWFLRRRELRLRAFRQLVVDWTDCIANLSFSFDLKR